MHPIPLKLRETLSNDPEMRQCIHNNDDCNGRVEWEHSFIYKNQIQEEWAIIGCCTEHHRGNKLDKDFNRYISLKKAIKIYGSL